MTHIQQLLQTDQHLFHTADLGLLWGITNPNSLNTTISRYVKNGVLHRLHKGFYSSQKIAQLSPDEIGLSALHTFAYISTETVLFREGIIHQKPQALTMVSDSSKHFELASHAFLSRQMKPELLFNDTGMVSREQRRYATVERAVADLLYYNPHTYFDAHDQIDWGQVKQIQASLGLA